ncbi:MAG: hypothetical protein J6X03_00400, partial [Bacilli bacterium]|nr:hypothetical protein [Bacilli bacterium]
IIDIFSSALEKKDLNGISKQEFFNKCEKYVDKYTINFTDINDITTFKPLIRNGVVGLCSEFNMRSIIEKNNLFNSKTAKKIADGAERNPSILCDVTLEFLYNQIFNYMSTKALKEFILNAEKKNFNIKQKVAEQLLMINGKFLPQLVKYIPSVSLNDLAFYTDRTTFNSLTDSEIVDFSNTCLSLVSDDDLVDMAIILIRGTNRTDVVLKAIENGRFKNIDSSRLYNMSISMKSFPINDEYKEFINSLISFKNNGLLNYSENTMVYNRDELVKNLIDSLDKFTAVCSTIDATPRYYVAEQCECESGTVDSATNNIRISISQPLRGISVSN